LQTLRIFQSSETERLILMAKIVRRHIINTVKQGYFKHNLLLYLCIAAVIFCAVLAFYTYGISLIIIPFLLVLIIRLKKQVGILLAGVKGEENTLETLSLLPDVYFVICDVTLCVKNKTAQIDYIVVGPTGIFIIECKNLSGSICGNVNDRYLYKTKNLSNSSYERKEIYNPLFQVATHSKLLSELLFEKKIYNIVSGCVYFSSPKAEVNLSGSCNISVFSKSQRGDNKLLDFICQGKKEKLTPRQIKRIKNYIFSHCK